jgi:hypothetical protein
MLRAVRYFRVLKGTFELSQVGIVTYSRTGLDLSQNPDLTIFAVLPQRSFLSGPEGSTKTGHGGSRIGNIEKTSVIHSQLLEAATIHQPLLPLFALPLQKRDPFQYSKRT